MNNKLNITINNNTGSC